MTAAKRSSYGNKSGGNRSGGSGYQNKQSGGGSNQDSKDTTPDFNIYSLVIDGDQVVDKTYLNGLLLYDHESKFGLQQKMYVPEDVTIPAGTYYVNRRKGR